MFSGGGAIAGWVCFFGEPEADPMKPFSHVAGCSAGPHRMTCVLGLAEGGRGAAAVNTDVVASLTTALGPPAPVSPRHTEMVPSLTKGDRL